MCFHSWPLARALRATPEKHDQSRPFLLFHVSVRYTPLAAHSLPHARVSSSARDPRNPESPLARALIRSSRANNLRPRVREFPRVSLASILAPPPLLSLFYLSLTLTLAYSLSRLPDRSRSLVLLAARCYALCCPSSAVLQPLLGCAREQNGVLVVTRSGF